MPTIKLIPKAKNYWMWWYTDWERNLWSRARYGWILL